MLVNNSLLFIDDFGLVEEFGVIAIRYSFECLECLEYLYSFVLSHVEKTTVDQQPDEEVMISGRVVERN
ncbi:hypothetical protein NC653_034416 [Populus alba x Populus x berolinensis]|uniref:Uncharacterized protein n=1 Tax=Populus alba x Populus x berolinensis TaxID=444605 RepID=A0AAD6LMG8_9ROSI|nr:hypothetical protein NC653_034416 [Populus alba x Populus x berolinensis]